MFLARVLCGFALVIGAYAVVDHYAVHEKRTTSTHGWQKRGRAHPEMMLPMRIALAHRNLDSAAESLMNISDPSSPHFSQYWSVEKINRELSPSKQTVTQVVSWLNESGIFPSRLRRSFNGDWISFNATVKEVEALLRAQYHIYERTGGTEAACDEYSIPTLLRDHVEFLIPTIHLSGTSGHRNIVCPRRKIRKRISHTKIKNATDALGSSLGTAQVDFSVDSSTIGLLANCYQYTTIPCLQALYNISENEAAHPNNSLGIIQLAWISWLPGDLDSFFSTFMPSLKGHRPTIERIDGGYWQDVVKAFPFNAEADLDFEYSMSLVYPQNVINYQLGDEFLLGTLNDFLAALDNNYCKALDPNIDSIYPDPHPGGYNGSDCGNHRATNVISISYANDEITYPAPYLRRQCLEFLKLGLRGVTVIASTADYGVAGQSGQCIDTNTGQVNGSTGYFNPTFPASCPFVTSVGGTQLPVNSTVSDDEVAFYQIFGDQISSSGGGFSNLFSRPAYQSEAVERYFHQQYSQLHNLSTRFNTTGRGFPDVAANAANYVTVIDGELMTVFGTSASTPVFASIITKINNARLKAGKRTVGFLNPVLYSNPHVMNDIVNGFNHGCGVKGFNAAKGWDPVTGLGTPSYERLLDLYLRLP